jgi:tRNA-dihydrouridine synthase B
LAGGYGFYIGGLLVPGRAVLAPMAGYTEYPFRAVVASFGCPLAVTPLVSAKGLTMGSRSSVAILCKGPNDADVVAGQIFGAEPAAMAEAARRVADAGFDLVDINLGCPIKKIHRQSAGAALTADISLLRKVVRAVVKASPVPVTAKMRVGLSEEKIDGPEVARLLENEGVACVAVHGRTTAQGFSGKSNPERIADVVTGVDIPVIANGDVNGPSDAAVLLGRTGAAAVMIGRAALREPDVVDRTDEYIRTGIGLPGPGVNELVEAYIELFDMNTEIYGEERAAKIMRKFMINLMKGFPGARHLRLMSAAVSSRKECLNVLEELRSSGTAKRL